MTKFTGEVAVVTGSNSDIGQTINGGLTIKTGQGA